jgi:tight adherence protein C
MNRLLVLSGLAMWLGITLLLSRTRRFSRVSLINRLRPYGTFNPATHTSAGVLSAENFRDAMAPLARSVGDRLSRILGVGEDLGLKLRRIHAPTDVTAFRLRQAGYAVLATGIAAVFVTTAAPPAPIALLALCGTPLLVFVLLEQQVTAASRAWQRRVFLELPVMTEQLAMLLAAGYSLSNASRFAATVPAHATSPASCHGCGRDSQRARRCGSGPASFALTPSTDWCPSWRSIARPATSDACCPTKRTPFAATSIAS